MAAEAQNLEGFLFGFGWREGREHEYEYEEPSLGKEEEDGLWSTTKGDSIGIAITSLTTQRHRHPPTKLPVSFCFCFSSKVLQKFYFYNEKKMTVLVSKS